MVRKGLVVSKNEGVYYVYVWYYEDDVIYVGKGKGARYKHGNSGCSGNFGLNQIYFTQDNSKMRCEFVKTNLSEKDALQYETLYIAKLKPSSNIFIDKIKYQCYND